MREISLGTSKTKVVGSPRSAKLISDFCIWQGEGRELALPGNRFAPPPRKQRSHTRCRSPSPSTSGNLLDWRHEKGGRSPLLRTTQWHTLRSAKGSSGVYFVTVSIAAFDQKPLLNALRARCLAPTDTEVRRRRARSKQAGGISGGPSSIARRLRAEAMSWATRGLGNEASSTTSQSLYCSATGTGTATVDEVALGPWTTWRDSVSAANERFSTAEVRSRTNLSWFEGSLMQVASEALGTTTKGPRWKGAVARLGTESVQGWSKRNPQCESHTKSNDEAQKETKKGNQSRVGTTVKGARKGPRQRLDSRSTSKQPIHPQHEAWDEKDQSKIVVIYISKYENITICNTIYSTCTFPCTRFLDWMGTSTLCIETLGRHQRRSSHSVGRRSTAQFCPTYLLYRELFRRISGTCQWERATSDPVSFHCTVCFWHTRLTSYTTNSFWRTKASIHLTPHSLFIVSGPVTLRHLAFERMLPTLFHPGGYTLPQVKWGDIGRPGVCEILPRTAHPAWNSTGALQTPGLCMRCQKNHHSFTNSYKTWREFVSIYKSYNHLWAPACSGHWPPNPLRASNL